MWNVQPRSPLMQTQKSEDASASTSSKIPVDSESEVASSTIAPDTTNSNIKGITLVAPIGVILSSILCVAIANIFYQAPSHQLSC